MSDIFKCNPTFPGRMKERRRSYFSRKQLKNLNLIKILCDQSLALDIS